MGDRQFAIPDRAFFKASEVCEIAQVQAYVLRTWELEFPSLGVSRPGGRQRIYRRQDVERVLEIRKLVFDEGLTLSGARRRLEGDDPSVEEWSIETYVAPEVRKRLASVKSGLQSLLTLLEPVNRSGEAESSPASATAVPAGDGELFPRDEAQPSPPRLTMARPSRVKRAKPTGRNARQGKTGRR